MLVHYDMKRKSSVHLISVDHVQINNGSLKINRAEIRDAGIYICVAQNSAGTALSQVILDVQGLYLCVLLTPCHQTLTFSSTNNQGARKGIFSRTDL